MIKKTKLIIIIVFVAILSFAGYVIYRNYKPVASNLPEAPAENNNQQGNFQDTDKPEPKLAPAPENPVPSGWKLYKNSDFGFEIQYPESWSASAENIENVRGENTKGFFFRKPGSDLRFAILPKDGLSYSLPDNGISEDINISGYPGVQTKYIMPDGRRLLIVHPQVNIFSWDQEIGRLDIESGAADPVGDFTILNKMLNSFKFSK